MTVTFALFGFLILAASMLTTFLFLAIGLPAFPEEMIDAIHWLLDFMQDGVLRFKYLLGFTEAANVMFVFLGSIIIFYGVVMPIWRIMMFVIRKIPGVN